MKRKYIFLIIPVLILAVLIIRSNHISTDKKADENNPMQVLAQSPEEAAFMMSDQLFEDGEFADISITDTELTRFIRLNKYEDLTKTGTIYSYEFVYRFKTDDARAFIDNKVTGRLVETNVWLEDVIADRCLVLFENEGVYYQLLCWDSVMLVEEYNTPFYYTNADYGGSDNCPKDALECQIIQNIFENTDDIPQLEMAEDATSDSILNKLVRDIEMWVEPAYRIDKAASRIYDLTFDDAIKCINFKADLYDAEGKEIVKNEVFSLFGNGAFSVYDVDKLVPKSID